MRSTFYFILYLITFALTVGISVKRLKDRAYEYHKARRLQAWKQCSAHPQSPVRGTEYNAAIITGPKIANIRRNRRDVALKNVALLVDGNIGTLTRENEKLELDDVPSKDFSVELWIKPEGGQQDPAIILKAKNLCSTIPSKGWELGIKVIENYKERNARLYFSLESVQNQKPTLLFAPFNYKPSLWIYVAVSYNRNTTVFYINGVQVAISKEQKGDVFLLGRMCSFFHLGGYQNSYFRGTIDNLRIWNYSLSSNEIKKYMKQQNVENSESELYLVDKFETLDQWIWNNTLNIMKSGPKLVSSDIPTNLLSFQFMPPVCGFTLCDVPDIVKSYQSNLELRHLKKIRYRIINVRNSDGSNPTVTDQQIINQHRALQSAFIRYNISWELHKVSIYNTTLRSHTIMFGCNPQKIGDGKCNPECQFLVTGNDGGDCNKKKSKCSTRKLENGICNPECNQAYNNWDNGDCCKDQPLINCIDPSSPSRIYLDIEEYKALLNFNNSKYLNILFANWTNKDILGIATFPWEKEIYSEYGGVVVKPDEFGRKGKLDTLIHELGHVLGLWHVHHGITEVDCHDQCFEKEARMDVGDLCEDTNPTPSNEKCHDPSQETERCGISKFLHTPFKNYMSYSDCANSFTEQQVARMHCYIDLQYQRWSENFYILPAPPIPPKIISSSSSSAITLAWIPPLSRNIDNIDCSKCTKDLELIQYAQNAEFSGNYFSDFWQPSQATGPPDAQFCSPSDKVWISDFSCMYENCILNLTFQFPVIPSLLSIWITWNAKDGLKEIEIIFTDESNMIITDINAYCDIPFTIPLFVDKELSMVRLKINSFVGIDSVQIISTANNDYCAKCKPLRYKVFRTPEFSTGLNQEVDTSKFTDNDIKLGEVYTYTVQALIYNYSSHLSPPLTIKYGKDLCGDGKINEKEQCDDGNIINNDGCNMKCEIEESYMCNGEPSLCYWHKGDGKCEDFEIKTVISDCGHYTPDQFEDQWATSAYTSSLFISDSCLPDIVVGPPENPERCESEPNANISWHPCESFFEMNYWLTISFSRPVVATSVFFYIGSDGLAPIAIDSNHVRINLLDSNNVIHYSSDTFLSCSQNPFELKVVHDLSKPFYLTSKINITFESSDISITAVSLRSAKYLNPVILNQCKNEELYSPKLQKCVMYSNCKKPACSKPLAKNYQLNCTGYKEGDYCYIKCNEGYYTKTKDNIITCINGEWIGSDIYCKSIDCGEPKIMHAYTICPDGTTLGKTCNFKCKPPARLKGDIIANTIICEANGFWSIPDTPCQMMCPPLSLHPSVIYSKPQCQIYSFQTGQRCYFHCKSGYQVIGQPKKKKFYVVCDSHGLWQGPKCVPINGN